MDKILVSACLLGKPVRHDGSHARLTNKLLQKWQRQGRVVSVCPETLAGFPTPRPAAEIQRLGSEFKVFEDTGSDVTEDFVRGAQMALAVAKSHACKFALLKENSPSCGSGYIYDGSFSGKRAAGAGVAAALLARNGIRVFSEERIFELAGLLSDA